MTTIIAYEQVRFNDFVNYDDDIYVIRNRQVKAGITRESILWAFTTSHAGNWHPVTWLSHMLDCEFFGLNPLRHHMTSLLLHIANTLLLFWVLKRMTKAVWCSGFAAVLFALHPVHVESVAWVAERKDVLSGFFWMLTMAAYVRYAERPGITRYLLVFLAFVLGLMAKPMLVTLPFVLLLLDWWPLERFAWLKSEPVKINCQRTTTCRLIAEKIPLFVLAAVSCVVTYTIQKSSGAVSPVEAVPLNPRITNALVSYISYIGKMIYPSKLAVLYPHPGYNLPLWKPIAAFLILSIVSVCVIYAARLGRRYLAVGWLWYIGILVPVIGLVQVGAQGMADRYTYLPSVGFFIVITYGAVEFFSKRNYQRILLGISAGLVLFVLLICTRVQVRYWRDSLALFERALAVTKDNYQMHNNLAYVLKSQDRFDGAIGQYRKALRIAPNNAEAHFHLGNLLRRQGELDEAIGHYLDVVVIKPDHADAHNNLGYAFRTRGEFVEAISHFRQALKFRPDWPSALNGIAQILAAHYDPKVRNADEAIELAERAAELSKYKNATILDTLAISYAAAGQFEQAVEAAQAALVLATAEKNNELVGQIRKRLDLFKEGKAYRLPIPP